MKLNKFFIAGAMASALFLNTACVEDYQELNQDPANVTKTMPEGLLTAAINAFQPSGYLVWYNNVTYYTAWAQLRGGAYEDSYTSMGGSGDQGGQYINTLKYLNKIKAYVENTGEVENNGYLAATGILTVYLGIFDTDIAGSIPYVEACHYDDLGILTPNYDTVESLYDLWITELNDYIGKLQASDLASNPKQDPAYGADWNKWARLANSLKLKIAARLYNNNPTKAISIVKEAASNSAGLITDTKDDFLFCKATQVNTGNLDYQYGTGNGLAGLSASNHVLDFMLGAKDPRVRFIYTKNGFNSKVVQNFIDNGKYDDLPSQVKANVVLDAEGNFKEWGGMGEPWVRYTSIPVTYAPQQEWSAGRLSDELYKEYFETGLRYQVTMTDASGDERQKSYSIASAYNNEMRQGRLSFTLPTAMSYKDDGSIDMNIIQDTDPNPLWLPYLTAGEVNLYLAEFATLSGEAIGGKSAQAWYEAGVRASVEEYNTLAAKNKIPYYGTTYNYDPFEKAIDLVDGEIDAMLATDNVKLTGNKADDLEKIYLQQLMHFSEQCSDQFVTARRSGYPKVGSSLLPYEVFPGFATSGIPRRFVVNKPLETDIMCDITLAAYEAQGFKTFGINSQGAQYNSGNAPLNTERLWQDKNAPQWGAGMQ